jgi:phycocyanin beta chain
MTYDAFTKVVAQADALSAVVADSFKRLDAVNRIPSNASKLVSATFSQSLFISKHGCQR